MSSIRVVDPRVVLSSLPSAVFSTDGKVSSLPSVIFLGDGKVYITVRFSLPSADDGKPFLCCLPDEKLTAKTPPDGKLAVSRSECNLT